VYGKYIDVEDVAGLISALSGVVVATPPAEQNGQFCGTITELGLS
jgi:hypothetical protein